VQQQIFVDWPHRVPIELLQRMADAQATVMLERASPAVWRAWQRERLRELVNHAMGTHSFSRDRLGFRPSDQVFAAWDSIAPASLPDVYLNQPQNPPATPQAHGQVMVQDVQVPGVQRQFWTTELARRLSVHAAYADHARHGRDLRAKRGLLNHGVGAHSSDHVTITGIDALGEAPQLARDLEAGDFASHAKWLVKHELKTLSLPAAALDPLLDALEHIKTQGTTLPHMHQLVVSGAAVTNTMRQRALALLGAAVSERYGTAEIGPIAFECPHTARAAQSQTAGALHVAVAHVHVDVINPQGAPVANGERGRVLATALHQWATPMIRLARQLPGVWCEGAHPDGLGTGAKQRRQRISSSILLPRLQPQIQTTRGPRVTINSDSGCQSAGAHPSGGNDQSTRRERCFSSLLRGELLCSFAKRPARMLIWPSA
jgi:hypothetical protein